MHDNLKNFQFTCLHEADVFPPLDPEADKWFKQAVQLSRQDNPDLKRIAQLYRQAAEKDHYI
ncbi:sel1 repeat family protein, partial [Proteus vulgaris]|nr:sel1 repeat family protein [Proteus vulgaris]